MFGTILKQLRKEKKLTQMELADMLGITQQAVGKWETGRSEPDQKTLLQLAEFFSVSLDSLLGRVRAELTGLQPYNIAEAVEIPILGTVKAGYGAFAFQEDLGTEPANVRDPENYFYLVVKGDSMEPRIQEGDLALVHRQQSLNDGDLGVVVYGDEAEGTLKRFLRKGNAVILQPFNPSYETVVLAGEELNQLYVAGKVVETKSRW